MSFNGAGNCRLGHVLHKDERGEYWWYSMTDPTKTWLLTDVPGNCQYSCGRCDYTAPSPPPPWPACGHCDSPLYCVDFDRSAANAGTIATSTHETILGIIEDHGGSKCFDMDKIFTSRNVMDNVERDMAASQFAQGVDTTLITGRYHNKVCESIPNDGNYWEVEISYNDDGSVNSFVHPHGRLVKRLPKFQRARAPLQPQFAL